MREELKRNWKSIAWTMRFGAEREVGEAVPEAGLRPLGRIQPLEQQVGFDVPSVAPDRVPNGPRPDADIRRGAVVDPGGEGPSDIQQLLRLGPELLETLDPFGKNSRGILQNGQHPFSDLAQLYRRNRLRALRMLGLFRRLENQIESVPDSLQDLRAEARAVHELAARLSQGDQVPGQIAAVHGGNVYRLQRPQVPGVVPIAEVTADAVQCVHGLQRGLEPFRGVQNPDPTEIMGSHRTEQIETQIGRRGAVGSDRLRVFLKVVRREGMLLARPQTSRRSARSGER